MDGKGGQRWPVCLQWYTSARTQSAKFKTYQGWKVAHRPQPSSWTNFTAINYGKAQRERSGGSASSSLPSDRFTLQMWALPIWTALAGQLKESSWEKRGCGYCLGDLECKQGLFLFLPSFHFFFPSCFLQSLFQSIKSVLWVGLVLSLLAGTLAS